jgi:hypothetical protein
MSFLKRVGAISLGKYGVVFGLIAGFVLAVVMDALGGVAAYALPNSHMAQSFASFTAAYGTALLIAIPLLGAVLTFLYFAVLACLYNYVAPRVGFLKVDLRRSRLNSIDAMSMARLEAVFALILGFVASCVGVAFFVPMLSAISPTVARLSVLSLLLIPIITVAAGICGFIGGYIYAFFYNLIADWVGGVQFAMRKNVLARVGVKSLVKVMVVLGAIFGLISGILSFSLVGLVVQPVTEVVFYLVYAAVLGLVYNFLANAIGGVELAITDK